MLYKTGEAVLLAKIMQGAALEFKAALRKERDAAKAEADLRLSRMRGEETNTDEDDDAARAGLVAASLSLADDTDEGETDGDESPRSTEGQPTSLAHGSSDDDGGGSSDEVDLDALAAELAF